DLGETSWGERVFLPLREIIHGCGAIGGGMGTGKSMVGSLVLDPLIDLLPGAHDLGFAVLDPKFELQLRTLWRLQKRLEHLDQHDPRAAKELRHRIIIIDFGARNPLSSYNIIARWPDVDPDFFASTRAELLLELLPGSDKLSLGGSALL